MRLLAITLLLSLCLVGCQKTEPTQKPAAPAPKKKPAASAEPAPGGSIFGDPFTFRCSPLADVKCSGVFPARPQVSAASAKRSEAAILWSGEDAFRARIATLKDARHSIRIQALIFRGDEAGLHIADLLKKKKKQGLDVRVIVDAASNLDWKTQWMYFNLKRHGVEVEGYEALYMQWVTAELKPTDPLRPNKRFHDKMWIVDAEDLTARVAIVGGLNIANEYFRIDPTPINRWTDQDVVLRGQIVGDVTAAFDRNYEFFKGIKRKRPKLLNPDNAWKLARRTLGRIKKVKVPDWRRPALVSSIKATLKKKAALVWRPVNARFLQSRPRFKETFIEQAYMHLIKQAKKTVLIANAYFIPSRRLVKALKDAARRGVRVVVLTNSPATNDIQPVATVSRFIYKKLMLVNEEAAVKARAAAGAGIELYEWSGAPFKEGTLHAKYAVFDGEAAIIGSYNLDPRSERLNSETALALRDSRLAAELERQFIKEQLPKSHKVTAAEAATYRRPRGLKKTFELLFALPLKDWL